VSSSCERNRTSSSPSCDFVVLGIILSNKDLEDYLDKGRSQKLPVPIGEICLTFLVTYRRQPDMGVNSQFFKFLCLCTTKE